MTKSKALLGYILAQYIDGDDEEPTRSECVDLYIENAIENLKAYLFKLLQLRNAKNSKEYLQTEQRIAIYAYLPSHHGYSNLPYEELASLRNKLTKLLMEEGIEGIKRFSRNMRKERRIRPKTVLQLNRSIYGVPDAGQSFAMFMQSLHLKKCGMVQSELDPCIYYKIMPRDNVDEPDGNPILALNVVIDFDRHELPRFAFEGTLAMLADCAFVFLH